MHGKKITTNNKKNITYHAYSELIPNTTISTYVSMLIRLILTMTTSNNHNVNQQKGCQSLQSFTSYHTNHKDSHEEMASKNFYNF